MMEHTFSPRWLSNAMPAYGVPGRDAWGKLLRAFGFLAGRPCAAGRSRPPCFNVPAA
ncbi:protein of unknown function [Paraburkholderia kururiensis]